MSNKELAIEFLQTLAANQVREAYRKFVSHDFIHHNQYFDGDRESLMLAMEEAHAQNPNTQVLVKQAIEDIDKVILYSHVKHSPQDLGYAVVHIFRITSHKIVEMWDVGQEIIPNSPNKNGLF